LEVNNALEDIFEGILKRSGRWLYDALVVIVIPSVVQYSPPISGAFNAPQILGMAEQDWMRVFTRPLRGMGLGDETTPGV